MLTGSKASNQLALPGAKGKVAYITRADFAAAIAGALTQSGHVDKIYEISGPEAVDLYDIARSLSEARGTPVTVVDADPTEFRRVLASEGFPDWLADGYLDLFAAAAAGEHAIVSKEAERLGGCATEPMTTYVKRFA